MQKQGKGAIVNLASIAGLNGIPYAGPYASTKHAVVGLTKSAALDHARAGVRVNAVAPGAIKTDILAKQLEGGDPNYNEASISAMHPMNRLGRPEEIANGISFLLSDEAASSPGTSSTSTADFKPSDGDEASSRDIRGWGKGDHHAHARRRRTGDHAPARTLGTGGGTIETLTPTATASPTKSSALSRTLPRMKSGVPCPARPTHARQSSRCQGSTGPTTASATS